MQTYGSTDLCLWMINAIHTKILTSTAELSHIKHGGEALSSLNRLLETVFAHNFTVLS